MKTVASAPGMVPMVLPPGFDKITLLVAWGTGIVGVLLILAWVMSVGKTGIGALRRGELEGGTAMIVVLFCGIALGATSAIFAALGIAM